MNRPAIAAFAAAFFTTSALADVKSSDADAKKLSEAAAALGYTGGTAEKGDEGSGVYEIDDAKAKDGGRYDVKFNKDFKLLSVTRD
jgi:Peptidase propeptide and YPEB domain